LVSKPFLNTILALANVFRFLLDSRIRRGSLTYIIALDIGTTSVKGILLDVERALVVEKVIEPLDIAYPKPGWCEQSPDGIFRGALNVLSKLISHSKVNAEEVAGISIDAQMLGVMPIDREGEPLYNLINWLDVRAAGEPSELFTGFPKISGYNVFKLIKFLRRVGGAPSKTGKDPLSKIVWIKKNMPEVYSKTWKFLNVNGLVVYKLTGNPVINADEAHVTWLADVRGERPRWHTKLVRELGLDVDKLPDIKLPIEVAGSLKKEIAREVGLSEEVRVVVGSGDVAATAIGSGAVEDYEAHLYIGTGTWQAAHVPYMKIDLFHAIGTLVSAIPGRYLLIADQAAGCDSLDYVVKLLYGEVSKKIYDEVGESVMKIDPASNRVFFLPWLSGERVPIDDPYVRGVLFNISLSDTRFHAVEAIMEGLAFNVKWAYMYFERLLGRKMSRLNIVGGGALWNSLCQIIADATGLEVWRMNTMREASVIGAAVIGLKGLGLAEFEYVKKIARPERVFKPREHLREVFDRKFKLFVEIYKRNKKLFKLLNK